MKTADQITLEEAIYIVEINKRAKKIEEKYRQSKIDSAKKKREYSRQAMNVRRFLSNSMNNER